MGMPVRPRCPLLPGVLLLGSPRSPCCIGPEGLLVTSLLLTQATVGSGVVPVLGSDQLCLGPRAAFTFFFNCLIILAFSLSRLWRRTPSLCLKS